MKVICSAVMSLDGFIADKDDKTISGPDDWATFAKYAKEYKNFVIGRGTNGTGALDNIDCKYRIMVSTHSYDNNNFVRVASPEEALRFLEDKAEIVYVIGGGKLNASFAKAGLIDELVVTVLPRTVGGGVRLFGEEGAILQLEPLSQETLPNGSQQLTYRVKS